MTEPVGTRVNAMWNPRAVASGAAVWPATQGWGTGGAGTWGWATDVTGPPGVEVYTARRKTWTTGASDNGNSGMTVTGTPGGPFPVTAGYRYAASVYARVSKGGAKYAHVTMWWKNGTGAEFITAGERTALEPGKWTRLWVIGDAVAGVAELTRVELDIDPKPTSPAWQDAPGTWATAPAGATWADPKMTVPGTMWAAGDQLDATAALVETMPAGASAVRSYFDGSTADTALYEFEWLGAAHASMSRGVQLEALVGASCEVWIGGVRYADGCYASADETAPTILSGLTLRWGRSNTIDQPQPAICTFSVRDPDGGARYDESIAIGATVQVFAQISGGARVGVFSGRITDLDAVYDNGAALLDVAAVDQLSELANRFVGAEPWGLDSAIGRVQRILSAVGVNPAIAVMPARMQPYGMTRRDVDRQQAASLLYEVSRSLGAALFMRCKADGTVDLYFEDPAARAALVRFVWDGTWYAPGAGSNTANVMDACLITRDPVHWIRDVTDILTRVTARWLDQTTTPDPTERSVMIADTAAEATYGSRGLSISTQYVYAADANELATSVLAQHAPTDAWRVDGLQWDLGTPSRDSNARSVAGKLLDSMTRAGLALSLINLPEWTPTTADSSLYCEGGNYTYRGGRWVLSVHASPSAGQGASMTFDTTPSDCRYSNVRPDVRYLDMVGVSA